ncbi:GNAT family N-acetyltransferase [Caldimonas mangrovi]|uniref:GNAT family N-acetyltransferase n=1 Tax=Caldimonas mangrovi TaxID=2944811 RepID=UPI0034A20858
MPEIRQVNAIAPKTAALLHWLQLEILPADEPAPTSLGWWWVASEGGNPVGFAGLWPSSRWSDAGYLSRSGVLPSARGRGLQKRLIRVREKKARELGWRWLITDTYRNPPSANSLIACGFRMFHPSKPWAADGACYWRKQISE